MLAAWKRTDPVLLWIEAMNRDEARDLMSQHVSEAAATLGISVEVLWPDTPQDIPAGAVWLRPTIRHAIGGQDSLQGAIGQRRFRHAGVLMVQIFTPVGDGMTESDSVVQKFLDYFETLRSSPIWYRNIRAMEVGKDGAAEQVNFVADFEYDNIH